MKWISFKKKKPEHRQKVLCSFNGLEVEVGVYKHYAGDDLQKKANRKGWGYIDVSKMRVPATHWMPMPKPPKMKK